MSNVKVGNKTTLQFQDYDYVADLPDAEREYLAKFNQEFYAHNFGDEPLDNPDRIADHDSLDGKPLTVMQQATLREHASRRDVWNNTQIERMETVPEALLEDVSTRDKDWEDVFKEEGYERAVEKLTDDTLDDLENKHTDKKLVLLRFHTKMGKLRRLNEAEKRKNGKDTDDE